LQRCWGEQSQQRFLARQRVLVVDLANLDHALDAPRRAGQHVADLVRLGRRQGEEATGPAMIEGTGIDAIQGERVEVHVQVERGSGALHEGHGAALLRPLGISVPRTPAKIREQ
jgi:hypothetical protein